MRRRRDVVVSLALSGAIVWAILATLAARQFLDRTSAAEAALERTMTFGSDHYPQCQYETTLGQLARDMDARYGPLNSNSWAEMAIRWVYTCEQVVARKAPSCEAGRRCG